MSDFKRTTPPPATPELTPPPSTWDRVKALEEAFRAAIELDPHMHPAEKKLHLDALSSDGQEHQDTLYPEQPTPPKVGDVIEIDKEKKIHLTATDVADPVQAIAFMHPVFAAAAAKHDIDLNKPAGRELQEMRKYFGQGSGTYLVTVDFQVARTEAFKLDERAQKKIAKALTPPKRKKPAKKKTARRSKR